MDLGLLRRIVVDLLLLPPGSIVVALLLGLLISKRWPRTGRAVLWSATVALYLLSTSLVSTTLARMTGDHAPFTPSAVGQAKAIVILAAEQNEAPEYGGLTVGDLTLERLRLGAKVARETGLPILVSGGKFRPGDDPSMARLMERTLHEEFRLEPRWLEQASQDTRENASMSAQILRTEHIDTVVLVTHYCHMQRSMQLFEEAGLHAVAAPVDIPQAVLPLRWSLIRPALSALEESELALHELIGLAANRLRF